MASKEPGLKIRYLSLFGCGISAYLLFHHLAVRAGLQEGPSFCSIGARFDCDLVAKSQFSEILGIPIASFGLSFYLGLFLMELLLGPLSSFAKDRYVGVMTFFATAALVPTLALAGVSAFILETFCLVCMGLYLVNALLFLVCFLEARREGGFVSALLTGLSVSVGAVGSFFQLRNVSDERLVQRRTGAALVFFLVFFALVSPHFMLFNVVQPVYAHQKRDGKIAKAVAEWQNAEPKTIPVHADGGPGTPDFVLGASDSPVTVVEFSDFQCPFCRKLAPELKKVLSKYQGRVQLVFKNFPLDKQCNSLLDQEFHQAACQAAVAARCAGQFGSTQFWMMHDAINQGSDLGKDGLIELAKNLELDTQVFTQCLDDPSVRERVIQDIELGIELGVRGTPALFVNGKRLSYPSSEALEQVLALALSN